ncbi:MAG: heavy-metal-associated domain-containing protein [Sedimenticola sp.]
MSRDDFIRMRGAWDTRHWIRIPSLSHEADGVRITQYLKQMDGVRQIEVLQKLRKIRVTYDQTKVDYESIKEQLEKNGFPISDSWWSRRKGKWFQYLDFNAKVNANASSPPCCSNPRGLNTGNRRSK